MDYMRFQKGLTLVCKRWWGPATRVLYNHVVLRRMSQVSALARTLSATDSGHDFGVHVKQIRLHDLSIVKPFQDVVLKDLRFVLQRCTTLRSFSMVPHTNYSRRVWHWLSCALDLSWMPLGPLGGLLQGGPAANLRHLELSLDTNSCLAIVELHRLLSQTTQLRSLKLEPLTPPATPEEAASMQLSKLSVLPMPALRELQFSTECDAFTKWATSSCQFPSLVSLTLNNYYDRDPLPFLKAHGEHLLYLNCYPHVPLDLDSIAGVSPMIEHLVVSATCAFSVLPDLHPSPTRLLRLRYLDIWLPKSALDPEQLVKKALHQAACDNACWALPVLGDHIRVLVSIEEHSEIPIICPPDALSAEEDARTVYIQDMCVVQRRWRVQALDFKDLADDDPDEDEDEDEDPHFVPDSEDEDDDGTSWISSDASASESETGADDNGSELEDGFDLWTEDQVVNEPLIGEGRMPRMCVPEV